VLTSEFLWVAVVFEKNVVSLLALDGLYVTVGNLRTVVIAQYLQAVGYGGGKVKEACRKHKQTHVVSVSPQLNDATRIGVTLYGQILHSLSPMLLAMKVNMVGRPFPDLQALL
jgi:hypothetical protein